MKRQQQISRIKKDYHTSLKRVFFTCFILSRSNESVSPPLPTGRTLHDQKIILHYSRFCFPASQKYQMKCDAATSHLETIDLSAELARSHGFFAPSTRQTSRVRQNIQPGFTDTSKAWIIKQIDRYAK